MKFINKLNTINWVILLSQSSRPHFKHDYTVRNSRESS